MDSHPQPATDEQILLLWKMAEGHTLRFARLLESYHGIGGGNVQRVSNMGRNARDKK